VTADVVIIAGNAYHALDRKLRGIMFPVNSFIVATEPLSEEIVSVVNPQDLAVCDPNFVLEYFRLSADKRLLFGGRCNYFGEDPEVIEKKLRPKLGRVYPQLASIGIDYAWGGTIGVPINRVPLFGRISPSIFYCQGFSGHGVNVTHLAGKILADGVDLAQMVPEWWRQQIVYMPQEPSFLNGSIRDNLMAGNPDLDDGALNALTRAAGLKSFIDQSPEGFDTPLTANGANLSLGVRRRLALARALATDGMLVVIDDPTEGLDTEGAQLVIDAMNKLSGRGRTIVVFSHDPQILAAASEYVDLDSKPVPKLVRKKKDPDGPVPLEAVPTAAKESGS